MKRLFVLWACILCMCTTVAGQDTLSTSRRPIPNAIHMLQDSVVKKLHDPRKATIKSAIIPGWGQAYNKKYWKIPLVYAAVGFPAYLYFDNRTWYQRTREAATMLGSNPMDTANFRNRVNEKLHIFFTTPGALNALLNYRNEFRKNMDYSILFVFLLWGLNVVDATVDGHLKNFDINDNLSVQLKPTILPAGNAVGLTLRFQMGK